MEEAYRHEKETKEAIEELLESCSLYQLKDTMSAADDSTVENRLLPAMNKIWPLLVVCVQQRNTVVSINSLYPAKSPQSSMVISLGSSSCLVLSAYCIVSTIQHL